MGLKADRDVLNWTQMFTRTEWYVVPIFWGPIAIFLFVLSLLQFTDQQVFWLFFRLAVV